MATSTPFDTELFQNHLKTEEIGKTIIYQDVTGSTMDDAREKAINETEKYPHGTVFLAERQTKARGARNHKWDSSNSGNLYISIVLHMPQNFKTFEGRFELEVRACLAVMKAARKFGIADAIPKWPNDIWVRGHKLCGNLVEDSHYDIPGTSLCLVILGMGINVNADVRRNGELYSIATSIMCENHGKPSSREEFFAAVCLGLEGHLAESRSNVIQTFREENLFQKGCDISVTCPSEGKVINAEFWEVCDNWEVSFIDKRTKDILHGRSDFYTIRPKVLRKILVVFTGSQGSRSASTISRWLSSLVDTSKFVVCLVPETAMTDSDEWMKTCDLLVLVEGVSDSSHVTSRLKSYLKRGGRLFASGLAAPFVAELMDIPVKESFPGNSRRGPNIRLVLLGSSNSEVDGNREFSLATGGSEPVAFLVSGTCLKFSQKYLEEGLSTGSSSSFFLPTVGRRRTSSSSSNGSKSKDRLGTDSAVPSETKKSNNLTMHYSSDEDGDYNVAMFIRPTTSDGIVALFGFDVGAAFPRSSFKTGDSGDNGDLTAEDEARAERDIQRLSDDRFRRDDVILYLLKNLNS